MDNILLISCWLLSPEDELIGPVEWGRPDMKQQCSPEHEETHHTWASTLVKQRSSNTIIPSGFPPVVVPSAHILTLHWNILIGIFTILCLTSFFVMNYFLLWKNVIKCLHPKEIHLGLRAKVMKRNVLISAHSCHSCSGYFCFLQPGIRLHTQCSRALI